MAWLIWKAFLKQGTHDTVVIALNASGVMKGRMTPETGVQLWMLLVMRATIAAVPDFFRLSRDAAFKVLVTLTQLIQLIFILLFLFSLMSCIRLD